MTSQACSLRQSRHDPFKILSKRGRGQGQMTLVTLPFDKLLRETCLDCPSEHACQIEVRIFNAIGTITFNAQKCRGSRSRCPFSENFSGVLSQRSCLTNLKCVPLTILKQLEFNAQKVTIT